MQCDRSGSGSHLPPDVCELGEEQRQVEGELQDVVVVHVHGQRLRTHTHTHTVEANSVTTAGGVWCFPFCLLLFTW